MQPQTHNADQDIDQDDMSRGAAYEALRGLMWLAERESEQLAEAARDDDRIGAEYEAALAALNDARLVLDGVHVNRWAQASRCPHCTESGNPDALLMILSDTSPRRKTRYIADGIGGALVWFEAHCETCDTCYDIAYRLDAIRSHRTGTEYR